MRGMHGLFQIVGWRYYWRRYFGWLPLQPCVVCWRFYWGGLPRFWFERWRPVWTWQAAWKDYCSRACCDEDIGTLE